MSFCFIDKTDQKSTRTFTKIYFGAEPNVRNETVALAPHAVRTNSEKMSTLFLIVFFEDQKRNNNRKKDAIKQTGATKPVAGRRHSCGAEGEDDEQGVRSGGGGRVCPEGAASAEQSGVADGEDCGV